MFVLLASSRVVCLFRMYHNLKQCRGSSQAVGGVRYRNAPAEEQPLTWNAEDQGEAIVKQGNCNPSPSPQMMMSLS